MGLILIIAGFPYLRISNFEYSTTDHYWNIKLKYLVIQRTNYHIRSSLLQVHSSLSLLTLSFRVTSKGRYTTSVLVIKQVVFSWCDSRAVLSFSSNHNHTTITQIQNFYELLKSCSPCTSLRTNQLALHSDHKKTFDSVDWLNVSQQALQALCKHQQADYYLKRRLFR